MSGQLNLKLKPGERDFYQVSQLKSIAKAKKKIATHNATRKKQISYRITGGGMELRCD